MNHDRVHCANYSDDCPKGCFRGELVRDLKRKYKDRWDSNASFADLEGTDGCLKGVITAEDWEKAVKNVEFFVPIYASLGYIGMLGLCILNDYLDRYRRGERSKELYESMISAK